MVIVQSSSEAHRQAQDTLDGESQVDCRRKVSTQSPHYW